MANHEDARRPPPPPARDVGGPSAAWPSLPARPTAAQAAGRRGRGRAGIKAYERRRAEIPPEHMQAAQIKYIGVNDKNIDLFEGQYPVPNGVSYNSYLILDEKTAVMDTADVRTADQWLQNLELALAGKEPDYLIISHMEPDHAGSLELAAKKYPQMKLVGNAKTFNMVSQFFDIDLSDRTVTVQEGDQIKLGSRDAALLYGANGALA